MTRDEHLMVIAMEECDEVSQRISKALRFGMEQVQPGQDETNRQRILGEFAHLCAALHMLGLSFVPDGKAFADKQVKVEAFLHYSHHCGTLHAAAARQAAPETCGHCGDGGVIPTQHGRVCATCYHPIEQDPIDAAVDAHLAEVGDPVKAFAHTLAKSLSSNRFDCPACGPAIRACEDGTCASCGADVVIVRDGKPLKSSGEKESA